MSTLPTPPVTVGEPATLETIAAAINILLLSTSQILANLKALQDAAGAAATVAHQTQVGTETLAQIPDPITLAQAKEIAIARRFKLRVNNDADGLPISVSFGVNVIGEEYNWTKTVRLAS